MKSDGNDGPMLHSTMAVGRRRGPQHPGGSQRWLGLPFLLHRTSFEWCSDSNRILGGCSNDVTDELRSMVVQDEHRIRGSKRDLQSGQGLCDGRHCFVAQMTWMLRVAT